MPSMRKLIFVVENNKTPIEFIFKTADVQV